MSTANKTEHIRILIGASLIALCILTYALLNGYGADIKEEVTYGVLKLVPELDRSLAQL